MSQDIISVENLLEAWKEFLSGKRARKDVQEFERNLMSNILALHHDLVEKRYRHSPYEPFNISDPKPRNIHKAIVRDRLLHHALYRKLYPFFDRTFVHDSYSCRKEKGTHRAMNRFREFAHRVSKNHTHTCWVLKCDIRKFFASIDQSILMALLARYIPDTDILWLLCRVIESFHSNAELQNIHTFGPIGPNVCIEEAKGLPLGNLTSQLFVNVYMNEFDRYAKHTLKARRYIRYADDFVFLSHDREWLESILPRVRDFLWSTLRLGLHPDKISIRTLVSGVDFLGWMHFPDHRVMRTTTKRRMFRTIEEKQGQNATVESYLGLLSHGNTYNLQSQVGAMRSTDEA